MFLFGQTSNKHPGAKKYNKEADSNLPLVFGTLWNDYSRATREKDFDKFADLFTEDALIVFSTTPENVKGRPKIKDFAKSLYSGVKAKGIVVETDDIQHAGKLAVQTGRFVEEYTEAGKTVIEKGRFSCAISRGKDGKWKIHSLVAFADSIK